jgi:F0F1-type ATP synthase delta subunit
MKRKIPAGLITPTDVAVCLEELRKFQMTVQKGRLSQRVGVADKLEQVTLSDTVLELLGEKPTDKALIDAVAYLELLQLEAPVLHVTVVAELPTSSQAQISQWLRANCTPQALVAFNVNSRIAGGVIVRTPFHLHDYSFATKLEASRPSLLKELAHV